jgi:hypothetical protein
MAETSSTMMSKKWLISFDSEEEEDQADSDDSYTINNGCIQVKDLVDDFDLAGVKFFKRYIPVNN